MKKILSLFSIIFFLSCSSSDSMDIYDAARKGSLETITKTHAKDSNSINVPNHRGHTPLILACYRNQPEAAKLLIQLGADVNYLSDLGTALHAAVYQNNLEIVELLLKNGVTINTIDSNKQTALIMAVNGSSPKMVTLLLKHNPNIEMVDKTGRTAFVHAMEQRNEEISQLLKQ